MSDPTDVFVSALLKRFGDSAHSVAMEQARHAGPDDHVCTTWTEIAARIVGRAERKGLSD
jgi:hypothetical protein